MCGIFFCVFKDGECCQKLKAEALHASVIPLVKRRGPDCSSTKEEIAVDQQTGEQFKLRLSGSVLHLRGELTSQPLKDAKGNTLLWNGEVFGGIEIPDKSNDTTVVFNLLRDCYDIKSMLSTMSSIQGPWSFMYYQASNQSLWFGRDFFGRRSLVWHLPTNKDDILAVSSVALRSCPENDCHSKLIWEEIPADGIYCLEFSPTENDPNHTVEGFLFSTFRLKRYTWGSLGTNQSRNIYNLEPPVIQFNKQLPSDSDLKILSEHNKNFGLTTNNVLNNLESSLVTVENINEKLLRTSAVTISKLSKKGEVSCEKETQEKGISQESSNSMSNVDSRTSKTSLNDYSKISDSGEIYSCGKGGQKSLLKEKNKSGFSVQPLAMLCNRAINCSSMTVDSDKVKLERAQSISKENRNSSSIIDPLSTLCYRVISNCSSICMSSLSNNCCVTMRDYQDNLPNTLIETLGEAVRKRVFNLPRKQHEESIDKDSLKKEFQCMSIDADKTLDDSSGFNAAKVGVLFSGGIDSIVLAVLADRFVPAIEPIDLINVGFEQKKPISNPTNKRKSKPSNMNDKGPNFDVPDRITGRSGLKELANINPSRQWRLIEVNVSLQDLQKARFEHITHLVSPLNSVLDDSIGCALWFAARGSGLLKCPACISGAESCQHPKQYTSKSKVLLVGMGADEQLGGYARHRTKFNQEGWLGLVNEMEMEVNRISQRNLGRDDRCISDHGREARFPFLDEQVVSFLSGLPVWLKADLRLPRGTGEKILLRKSARLLGLTSSAVLPKRAIQFGSRIAKLEGKTEKGSDTCTRLK